MDAYEFTITSNHVLTFLINRPLLYIYVHVRALDETLDIALLNC